MRNSIYIYYENQQSIYGDKWMDGILKTTIHEMGHTFGLGHYTTDDNDYNRKIATRDESPPSIMFAPAHVNPDLRKITEIDVQLVRSIYGSYGFHAFSEQRPSEIIIENPISPLDPTYPFESTEISKNTVKSQMRKALETLRNYLLEQPDITLTLLILSFKWMGH